MEQHKLQKNKYQIGERKSSPLKPKKNWEKLREKQFSAPSLGEYWHVSFLLYHSLIFEVGLRFAAAVQQGGQRPVPT